MTKEHPITPPPELVQQWRKAWGEGRDEVPAFLLSDYIATQAARWGADQELEACCEWVSQWCGRWPDGTRPEDALRASRRPKPPSLKAQALAAFEHILGQSTSGLGAETVRRALELLSDDPA